MSIDTAIRESEWWRKAQAMPDRHHDPASGISLADHLEATRSHLRCLRPHAGRHEYFALLEEALGGSGLDPAWVQEILTPVALLHDIGKPSEDKSAEGPHPLTGKPVKMRHPVVGVRAALELLPAELPGRDTILALIDEHDTPYGWFRQYQKTRQPPRRKSWARLDRKIDAREDGTGLILLAVFKLADIDGHDDVEDVVWFFESATSYLREKGKWLPVPTEDAIRTLDADGS